EGFGEYLRLYWYLQEVPTDEAVIGWNDDGLRPLNYGTWDASNAMANGMYNRAFYQITMANEFLRQSTDAKLSSRGQNDSTLRAKLYLNDSVYTGTPNWAGAVTEAATVIGSGYSLDPNLRHNFEADNNTSPELIFVAAQDGGHTQTWGGMTFVIHAGCGGAM